MLNRRDVARLAMLTMANLGAFLGIGKAAPDVGQRHPKEGPEDWDSLPSFMKPVSTYRNVAIHWTGWKRDRAGSYPSQDAVLPRGQWIAYCAKRGPYFFVDASGGPCMAYKCGDMFPLPNLSPDEVGDLHTALGRQKLISRGHSMLVQAIDDYLDNGVVPEYAGLR